jgi:argininosuccinate lyase
VRKGLPFRDAHEAVARAVRVCVGRDVDLADLSLAELREACGEAGASLDEDVHAALTLEGSVESRRHVGGTAPLRVRDEIAAHHLRLRGDG